MLSTTEKVDDKKSCSQVRGKLCNDNARTSLEYVFRKIVTQAIKHACLMLLLQGVGKGGIGSH